MLFKMTKRNILYMEVYGYEHWYGNGIGGI